MKPTVLFVLWGVAGALLAGCAERPNPDPPARSVNPSVTREAPPSATAAAHAPLASASNGLPEGAVAGVGGAPAAAAHAAEPRAASGGVTAADEGVTEPSLTSSDGQPLPQTEERPGLDTPQFLRRMQLLAAAIAQDDPSLARSVFFPVLAYRQVKAVAKPERDWQFRLVRNFERDIHEYHRSLGKDAGQAKYAGVEVPEASARWMKPGSEGNRLPYYRVLRSKLKLLRADQRPQTFEVTSMISWRGEWYVVHLHGFE